jgi:large subunit ribosomal protein L3
MKSLLGQKIQQGQKFLENGIRIPVTYVNVAGNTVISLKTSDKDHYNSIQMGMGLRKKANKARLGHAKKASLSEAPLFLKEVRILDSELENLPNLGDHIKATEVFQPGDIVDVMGTSKGKGFAGGVKRYGFHGGPKTHGQSDRHRAPGSIGQGTTPGRVYKGKRMAGRMGHEQVTIKNLKIVDVSDDQILIQGLVPGVLGSYLIVKKIGEDKKFVPLYRESVAADQAQVEEIIENTEPEVSTQALGEIETKEEKVVEVETQSSELENLSEVVAPKQSTEVSNDINEVQPENPKEEVKEDAKS